MQKLNKSGHRVTVLFYLLTGYVLLQFSWWAYLLIDLNKTLYAQDGPDAVDLRIWMVVGEGSVFLIFLLAGIFIMQRTIRKEIALVRQQRNFLLSITHELKTPVATIKLCLQTLMKRSNLEPEQREPLQKTAIENTERLNNLLENVLLATRIESGLEPVISETSDISELTKHIYNNLFQGVNEQNAAKLDIAPNIRIPIEKAAYESIFVNLVENAMKYASGSPVEISLVSDGKRAILSVADNGPGIPSDEKLKIFQKFYRMGNEETRSKKGTGLGLYIVKELVDMHHGRIQVEDNKPRGVKFRISFPLA